MNKPAKIKPAKRLEGEIVLPGDKSISHRAVMVSSLARGKNRIENFLTADDCMRTVDAFKHMGVSIQSDGHALTVDGVGLKKLKQPSRRLYAGNSGTTMRLLLGILSGQDFECTLEGDPSLSSRPMKRVTIPLRQMGADIRGKDDANFAPLVVRGSRLKSIDYATPVASAQVKSAVLFAGLYADGTTSVTEPFQSRDHTERMLRLFGADISIDGLTTSVKSCDALKKDDMYIPGDISGAAFFMIAALLLKGSDIILRNVGINETRAGIVDVLRRMGGKIEMRNIRGDWEPMCDIAVRSSRLKAATVLKSEIPRLIDELPALMVAAAFAAGRTVIRGAGELRVKETDRINSMVTNLRKMGAAISCTEDDVFIDGSGTLRGNLSLASFGDHRTAMAALVGGLCASSGESVIDDMSCVNTSFPGFLDLLKSLSIY